MARYVVKCVGCKKKYNLTCSNCRGCDFRPMKGRNEFGGRVWGPSEKRMECRSCESTTFERCTCGTWTQYSGKTKSNFRRGAVGSKGQKSAETKYSNSDLAWIVACIVLGLFTYMLFFFESFHT